VADEGAGGDEGAGKSEEQLKVETGHLRGSMRKTFDDITTSKVPTQDAKMVMAHGCIQQDDPLLREERMKLGLESAFGFTIRLRMPGGYCTAEQWEAIDDICGRFASNTLMISARQTWKLRGVLKRDVKGCLQAMNRTCLDTIAASGDVCCNVLCTSDPSACCREVHDQVLSDCYATSDHCLPRSGAYHETFLADGKGREGDEYEEKTHVLEGTALEEEPLYGLTYLPRQYRVAFAIPPCDDVGVFAHCCGFVAVVERGQKLLGYNVSVGGGALNQAQVIGFCQPEDCRYVAESVMIVQRDFGDRADRGRGSVEKTVEQYGSDWFRERVEERLGKKLSEPREYSFERRVGPVGWFQTDDGLWHCGCVVAGGRVDGPVRAGLRQIAQELKGSGGFRAACGKQLVITDVPDSKKATVQKLLDAHGIPLSAEALEDDKHVFESDDEDDDEVEEGSDGTATTAAS
jgi:sulfite reductase (NADPH) hemoprotein beta-component